ncbi:hypothetical protein L6452_08641 [Arctium lappa]|uniref:Uncharacterized protein n=1 Tax=Arctium lappa TaxID=4217 RepID=A0ACB9DIV8_ARCLA|nr:hypothetical protein L6452_08641 [Arctium lappa]
MMALKGMGGVPMFRFIAYSSWFAFNVDFNPKPEGLNSFRKNRFLGKLTRLRVARNPVCKFRFGMDAQHMGSVTENRIQDKRIEDKRKIGEAMIIYKGINGYE